MSIITGGQVREIIEKLSSVDIRPEEVFGVNTKEDLDVVSRFLKN